MIQIAKRLHPYSHQSGTYCLIPHTTWQVELFPTLLKFTDFSLKEPPFQIHVNLQGPVKDFTIELDLKRASLRLFGTSKEGYFCYQLFRAQDKVRLFVDKAAAQGLLFRFPRGEKKLKSKESDDLPLLLTPLQSAAPEERLSLGMHKAQDWDLMRRRLDVKELFPPWLALAPLIPQQPVSLEKIGTLFLVEKCKAALFQKEKLQIVPLFTQLFCAAFQGILSPRLTDELYLGLIDPLEKIPAHLSPLQVLHESAALIRLLFFQQEANKLALLPCLPPEFHSGRFLGLSYHTHKIDIEWSKKLLKQVFLQIGSDDTLELLVQKPLKSCRVRSRLKERGIRHNLEGPLPVRAGQRLILDRFEK